MIPIILTNILTEKIKVYMFMLIYLKCCVISRILNFHFLHTALILLLGKDRTESHMATDRSLETDCRNDFFPGRNTLQCDSGRHIKIKTENYRKGSSCIAMSSNSADSHCMNFDFSIA